MPPTSALRSRQKWQRERKNPIFRDLLRRVGNPDNCRRKLAETHRATVQDIDAVKRAGDGGGKRQKTLINRRTQNRPAANIERCIVRILRQRAGVDDDTAVGRRLNGDSVPSLNTLSREKLVAEVFCP